MSARLEAELISAIVNCQDMILVLDSGIEPGMFTEHADLYSWLCDYHRRTGKVPHSALMKVKHHFSVLKTDDLHGVLAEFLEAMNKQRLMGIMQESIDAIMSGSDVAGVADGMRKSLVDVYTKSAASANQASILTDWQSVYGHTAKRRIVGLKTGQLSGIPTGFPTLDIVTGGFAPSEYWVYAARLGQGKTWTLVRTAVDALRSGKRVSFFSLEQSKAQLSVRFHTFLSALYWPNDMFLANDLTQGKNYSLKKYKQFLTELPELCPGELILNDTPRSKLKATMIAAHCERFKPDLVIIDYLGLMSSRPGDYTAIMELSADLKGIATEYGVTMLAANQLNRTAESRNNPAGAESLSGSDSIGQDADGVVSILSTSARTQRIKLVKYRNGQDGMTWECRFEPNVGMYDEVSMDDFLVLKQEDEMIEANDRKTRK